MRIQNPPSGFALTLRTTLFVPHSITNVTECRRKPTTRQVARKVRRVAGRYNFHVSRRASKKRTPTRPKKPTNVPTAIVISSGEVGRRIADDGRVDQVTIRSLRS